MIKNSNYDFIFTDLKQQYSLSIRRGVCQFDETLPVDADLLLSLNKAQPRDQEFCMLIYVNLLYPGYIHAHP